MVPELTPIPYLNQFSASGSSGEIFTPEKSSQLNLNSEMPAQSRHRQKCPCSAGRCNAKGSFPEWIAPQVRLL